MARVLTALRQCLGYSSFAAGPRRTTVRPRVECLEDRCVPNATSWFDAYHPAVISAVQQEIKADNVSFAIDPTHRFKVISPAPVSSTFNVRGYDFATDIDAGRDVEGNAQCLVHGAGNALALYNVKSGWTDVSPTESPASGGFIMVARKSPWTVAQISAGNTGELYMLDSFHQAWKYEFAASDFGTAGWHMIGKGFSQIQASRGGFFETHGLYALTDGGVVAHHTSAGWDYLDQRTPFGTVITAHALSVNYNNDVFIIAGDHTLRRYDWDTNRWAGDGGANLQAINAVTGPNHESLVYAWVSDSYIERVRHGWGGLAGGSADGDVWRFTIAGGWQRTPFSPQQFSGASGSTLYVAFREDDDLLPQLREYRWDWATDGESLGTYLGNTVYSF